MLAEREQLANSNGGNITQFLDELREHLEAGNPDLLPLFDVFAQEARFARLWLDPSLKQLPAGSRILEIGAGLLLISCQLQREGFSVTALEPIGVGFSALSDLQKVVRNFSSKRGFAPDVVPTCVEELDADSQFPFAFSVNVMEHVGSVPNALERVSKALTWGGEYRFICPNYWFPYEPHFNIPTLVTKHLTELVFRNAIYQSTRVTDPRGTWESLNWINVGQVRRVVSRLEDMRVTFERRALARSLERVCTDSGFASRRPPWVRTLIGMVVALGIHRLTALWPSALQPTMDCRISKTRCRE